MRYNFSQPIKDNVEEAVSGVRGKVVLKIFGPDLAKMRATLEQAEERAARTSPGIVDLDLYRDASTPQLQISFDRAALARAGVSAMEDAQRTLETALAGRVVTTTVGRRAPGAGAPDAADERARRRAQDRRDSPSPTPNGARVPLRDLAAHRGRGRRRVDQPRGQQPLSSR